MTKKKPVIKDQGLEEKKNPEIAAIERDLDKFVALEILAESEGGRLVVDNLAVDIIALAEIVGSQYKTASHAELMGLCADIDNKLTILRLITRAKKNRELATEALKEALAESARGDE